MSAVREEMRQIIRGAGGKSGSGGAGGLQEDPDTLRSVAYAHIVDLISEGEIEGFPTTEADVRNYLQYVYFDGTPVLRAGGNPDTLSDYNFRGATFDFRAGSQSQNYIKGFKDTENEIQVGVKIQQASPVVRTINDATVDALRVTVSVPSLYQTNNDGSVTGSKVEYTIEVQSNGGGYVQAYDRSIRGKATNKYQRAHRIKLTDYGPAPWDIRITRVTADSASVTISNDFYWDSYTEIVEAKLRYPNSALAALKIDASQFDHIPVRAYKLRLLRVQVPSNYDPIARTYTGAWDGTFKIAWTDNPAWCYYDLLTNSRYGLGQYLTAAQVDKWALYTIGQYCDELVDDGKGGQEPRFTCNIYLQKRQDAYTAISQFASIFRGMGFWGGGVLNTVQDAPSDPVALYTNANVIDGLFSYMGSSRKARHSVALVTWNNPDDLYRQKVEYVEDKDAIARFGIVQTEVVAVGCTSQGQANRVGRWLLYSERLETEIVTFRTGLEGVKGRPGQVIQIADANRAGSRRGGRILAATTTDITLDAPVTLDPQYTYTLSVIAPGGVIAEQAVQVPAQKTDTTDITLTAALAAAPNRGAIWVLSGSDVAPQSFAIIGVREVEKTIYEIHALTRDPNKYTEVETGIEIVSPPISLLSQLPDAPGALSLSEAAHVSGNSTTLVINVGWDAITNATGYKAEYRIDDGNVIPLGKTQHNHIEVPLSRPGTYTVWVWSVNAAGASAKTAAAVAFDGTTITTVLSPPSDVVATGTTDGIDLNWINPVDVPFNHINVYRSNHGQNVWGKIGESTGTHYRDPNTSGSQFDYYLTAVPVFGDESPESAIVTAKAKTAADGADVTAANLPAVLDPDFTTGDISVGWTSDHGSVYIEIGNRGPEVASVSYAVFPPTVSSEALRNKQRIPVYEGMQVKGQALVGGYDNPDGIIYCRISWRDTSDAEFGEPHVRGQERTGNGPNGSYAIGLAPAGAAYAHIEVVTEGHTSGHYTVDNVWAPSIPDHLGQLPDDPASGRYASVHDAATQAAIKDNAAAAYDPGDNIVRNPSAALDNAYWPNDASGNPLTPNVPNRWWNGVANGTDQGLFSEDIAVSGNLAMVLSGEMDAHTITSGWMHIELRQYDSSGAEITAARFAIIATNGAQFTRYSQAFTTDASAAKVALNMRANANSASGSGGITWRKIKLEKGTAVTPFNDLGTQSGNQLTVVDSGVHLGGPSNASAELTMAIGGGPTNKDSAVTATSTGTFGIAAFTYRRGGSSGDVSYSAVSNIGSGYAQGTTRWAAASDPDAAGGTPTWSLFTTSYAAQGLDGAVVAGYQTVPSGGSSGGGGITVTGCLTAAMRLPDGRAIGDLHWFSRVRCVDGRRHFVRPCWRDVVRACRDLLRGDWRAALRPTRSLSPCVRVHAGDRFEIDCSIATPFPVCHDPQRAPIDEPRNIDPRALHGRPVWCGTQWKPVTNIASLGMQTVVQLHLGGRLFLAGRDPDGCIASHNWKK